MEIGLVEQAPTHANCPPVRPNWGKQRGQSGTSGCWGNRFLPPKRVFCMTPQRITQHELTSITWAAVERERGGLPSKAKQFGPEHCSRQREKKKKFRHYFTLVLHRIPCFCTPSIISKGSQRGHIECLASVGKGGWGG